MFHQKYHPTAVAAPSPSAFTPVDPLAYPDLLTPGGIRAAYDPTAVRPVSPTYCPHSPPPEDLYDPLTNLGSDALQRLEEENGSESPDSVSGVEGIRFFARSPEEILKLSCVRVTTDKISADGVAVEGGLRDPRFGCSAGRPCGTCGARANRPCNGHFGSYTLSEPLFNIMYIKYISLWLRLMCPQCGLPQPSLKAFQECSHTKLNSLLARASKKCKDCGACLRKSLVWNREQQLLVETSTGDTVTARDALAVFRKMSDDSPFAESVGHPRRFITTVLFVPSICIRPAVGGVKRGETPRGENDITYRLVKIIRADKLLQKKRADHSDPVSQRSAVLGLQNAYTGYLDASKTYQRSSKVNTSSTGVEARATKYKSLCDPLKGKNGIYRKNLSGKRVDHAMRGVIAPYENAHPSRLGVPKWVCNSMTLPIKVTSWNRKAMNILIQEKKALFVTNLENERIDLRLHPDPGELEIGWVVDRLLKQDDIVLFNRQPTLSRRSIIALRVDVLNNDSVLRLPLQLTPNFNADFDGDEMNLHVPQSIEARAEAETLLAAEHTVINSASGLASVVPVQGDRLGPMLMTDPNRTLTRRQWFACLGWASDDILERAREVPPSAFPCKASDLFSLALPDLYNWKRGGVEIHRGKLISGRVNKKVLNQLVHDIWHDKGTGASLDFVHGVNRVSGAFNSLFPTTITFEEVSNTRESQRRCDAILARERNHVAKVMSMASLTAEKKEKATQAAMARASRDITEYVFEHSSKRHTGFRDLVESGSKGNRVNFCMVLGCLGKMLLPRDVKGVFTPIEGAETTAQRRCFTTRSGKEPFEDAYVTSGYAQGMTLEQYAVHSKAGRVGLIDSANKVGKVGYQYRRVSTMCEALCARNGRVVDSSNNMVVSFKYGDDGRSPYYAEYEKMMIPNAPSVDNIMRAEPNLSKKQADHYLWKTKRLLADQVKKIVGFFADAKTKTHNVAVSVRRVLHDHRVRYGRRETGAAAMRSCGEVNALCKQHGGFLGEFMGAWLRVHLHPFALWGMSATGISKSLEELDKRLWKCRVDDGEPVGLLLSSSFSAAATQVTLNSFHNIGAEIGNFNGLEEVINLNKHRKTKLVRFQLVRGLDPAAWVARYAKVCLRDIVMSKGLPRKADSKLLAKYWAFPDEPGEFCFKAKMRLRVRTEDPFNAKRALLRAGANRVCYARDLTGDFLFQTDEFLPDSALEEIVSGEIQGCRLSLDKKNIVCEEIPDLLRHCDSIRLSSLCTNDFHKTREMLGVEAARLAISSEMKTLLKTFGVNMASRHIDLLADKMTTTGQLLGCTRHGLRKSNPDGEFVRRATFEQATNVLTRAAASGGKDTLNGPLARQVFGQTVHIGTHHAGLDVVLDKVKERQNAVVFAEDDSEDDDLDCGADSWIPQQSAVAEAQPAWDQWNTIQLKNDPWSY